jgi:uncharacterized protein (TIGR01777 family)
MRIVVSGGTGFLGQALIRSLRAAGHSVMVLTRRPRRDGDVLWSPDGGSGAWTAAVQAADVVINLAGEGLADRRWSTEQKARIRSSRINATKALADVIREAVRPALFVSASAIGIYGDRGDEEVTERDVPGTDFLARVCADWEHEAMAAADVTRVVVLRSGLVLAREGGALPRMALPYYFLAGGWLGSGRQYMSWIHRDDWVAMVLWVINRADVRGALNLTSPGAVRNVDFARTLGRVLHRPALVPVPAFALRLVVGEMADVTLLKGQRVRPEVALSRGFQCRYPELEGALREIYSAGA